MICFIKFHIQNSSNFLGTAKNPLKTSHADGVYTISISADIDDELADSIDARYDELLDKSRELLAEENLQGKGNFSIVTVIIDLKSGETSSAHIRPDLLF